MRTPIPSEINKGLPVISEHKEDNDPSAQVPNGFSSDLNKQFDQEVTTHQEEAKSQVTAPTASSTTADTTPKTSLRPSKYTAPIATVQTTLDGKPYKSTRYSLNVKLLEGHKGTVGLRPYYIEIFTAMQDFCNNMMLLPWNTEKDADFIKEPDKLPETITQLRKYFFGARSRDVGEDVYVKVNLAFPVGTDKPTFEDDFIGWAESRNIRFHETPVQYHNVKGVC